nr:uncharacterized protein LOC109173559 [Ipomoea batatas]
MEHLPVHLPYEARLGGPVQYRWMYPFERFLNFLKRKVKNKSRVEGSICEAFIIEETTTFASYYFESHVQSRHTRIGRNLDDGGVNNAIPYTLSVFNLPGRLMGASNKRYMEEKEADAAHQHILLNCKEVQPILRMFEDGLCALNPGITNAQVDKEVENHFAKWFQTYVNHYRDGLQNKFLIDLACGPLLEVKTYSGYIVNGYKFQTYSYCNDKSTTNCGVCVKGTGLAEGEADFYGILSEIVEIEYPNLPIKKVILFKCEWFDPKPNIGTRVLPEYGIVEVRQNRRYQKYDPFIIAQNASQVYYLPYPRGAKDKSNWSAVINVRSRGTFDDQYKLNTAFQQEVILTGIIGHAEYEEDQENLHEPNEMEEVDGNSLFEGIDEHINDNNDIDSESELEGSFDDTDQDSEEIDDLGPSGGGEGKRLGSNLVGLRRNVTWAACIEASKQEPKKEGCVPVATRVHAMTVGVRLHAVVVTDLYMAVGGMVVHAGVVTGMRLGYGQLGAFHGGWTCLVAY